MLLATTRMNTKLVIQWSGVQLSERLSSNITVMLYRETALILALIMPRVIRVSGGQAKNFQSGINVHNIKKARFLFPLKLKGI